MNEGLAKFTAATALVLGLVAACLASEDAAARWSWQEATFHERQVVRCNAWKQRGANGGIRIFDAFTFFEELDVLELRLAELGGCVDFHVIAEANTTHAGNAKELKLLRALEEGRYAQYRDRIRYIEVNDMPNCEEDPWVCENFQREALVRGLHDIGPDDFLLIGDLDEVPSMAGLGDAVGMHVIPEHGSAGRLTVFSMEGRQFSLNWKRKRRWDRAYGLAGSLFAGEEFRSSPQAVRDALERGGRRVTYITGGWHLSYFGSIERVRRKIASFAHQEFNRWPYTSSAFIESRVRCGKDLYERGEGDDSVYDPPTVETLDRFPALLQKLAPDFASSLAAARERFPVFFGHERAENCEALAAAAGAALDDVAALTYAHRVPWPGGPVAGA
eukprot:tig00001086_g6852.t1